MNGPTNIYRIKRRSGLPQHFGLGWQGNKFVEQHIKQKDQQPCKMCRINTPNVISRTHLIIKATQSRVLGS